MNDLFFESLFAKNSKFHWDFLKTFKDKSKWELLAKQYSNFRKTEIEEKVNNNLIPKKIHQVWIGPRPLPKKYKKWMDSWKIINKDWEYKLWTNKDLKHIKLINQKLFEGSNNIGFKSDILRYEILYQIGGLYIDTDLECIKKIPENFCNYDFISCIVFRNSPQIANGAILSKPKSLLIKNIIRKIANPKNEKSALDILKSSGADLVTKEYFLLKKYYREKCLILPSDYFYPWPNFLLYPNLKIRNFITDKTIGIHYWEVSWTKGNLLNRAYQKLKLIIKRIKFKKIQVIK